MKEITKELITCIPYYQAFDGTEFKDEQECIKYEESAAGVLLEKVSHFTLSKDIQNEMDESTDSLYRAILPTKTEHIDALNQLYFMYGGKNKSDAKFSKSDIFKPILLGIRIWDSKIDWLWFYKVEDFVKEVTANKFTVQIINDTEKEK